MPVKILCRVDEGPCKWAIVIHLWFVSCPLDTSTTENWRTIHFLSIILFCFHNITLILLWVWPGKYLLSTNCIAETHPQRGTHLIFLNKYFASVPCKRFKMTNSCSYILVDFLNNCMFLLVNLLVDLMCIILLF